MFTLSLNRERCKGCGLCIGICPQQILRLSSSFNHLGYHAIEVSDVSRCTGCMRCVTICPDVVIEIHRTDVECRPGRHPRKKPKGG